tara:strand:+ start:149 stop:1408 length:1260 start_codon:yes stop_codon:yes gene_type:complete
MAEIKAKVIDAEESSIQEKEEAVQKSSSFDEESGMYKVNLNEPKQETDAVQEQSTDEVPVRDESETSEKIQKENVEEGTEESSGKEKKEEEEIKETPILEEITDETTETDNTNEAGVDGSAEATDPTPQQEEVLQEEETQESIDYPENIIDLVKFMNETGGTLDDYVRLNADYSNSDENTLLVEYYKQTKPHLSYDEIQFLMEDSFSFDNEVDDEREIKRKKLALKEEVANAKNFLTSLKDQYYKEVKLGSKLAPEQQKAIDFFNRYNKEQKSADELLAKQNKHFKQQTDNVFNDNFKGFNFKVGDKKYRFNVKDAAKVKENQSDLLNVFNKYVGDNKMLQDAQGFHKSLFAASNPDAIANHFYEQGKADAIKQMSAEAKNINMDPRKTSDGYVETSGIKVRAISGDGDSKLKFKLKNY